MTTDENPADAVIEPVSCKYKFCAECGQNIKHWKLADPADRDEVLYTRDQIEALHGTIDQLRALIVEAGLETYTPDGSERVAAHLTEQQRIITGLRAQVAAVQALADEWEDDGPGCQLWPAYRRLRAALDTAGGEQHE